MTYRQVARKLRKLGCREREDIGRGSHRGWIRVGTSLSTTVPDKGSRDIAIGTLGKPANRISSSANMINQPKCPIMPVIGHRCERTVTKRDKSHEGGTPPHTSLVAKLQRRH